MITPVPTMTIIKVLFVLVATPYLAMQVRKPGRWIGRPFAWLMNLSHSSLTDWGLQSASIQPDFTILDVGCGGGRTIRKLAARAVQGKVYGVDYAAGSVAASRTTNEASIRAGRVEIVCGSVSQLPFPDSMFDLVTAVETQYYWPDLPNDMKQILRVLKPGGTLILIAETYKSGTNNIFLGSVMKLLGSPNLGVEDQQKLFSDAGFTDVVVDVETRKGWICATGKRAS